MRSHNCSDQGFHPYCSRRWSVRAVSLDNRRTRSFIEGQLDGSDAFYLLDVAKQTWKVYVAGAPSLVNTLSTIKATDVVILRR